MWMVSVCPVDDSRLAPSPVFARPESVLRGGGFFWGRRSSAGDSLPPAEVVSASEITDNYAADDRLPAAFLLESVSMRLAVN